jgi:hypothetical protein
LFLVEENAKIGRFGRVLLRVAARHVLGESFCGLEMHRDHIIIPLQVQWDTDEAPKASVTLGGEPLELP